MNFHRTGATSLSVFFFFNDTATTEIYTLSLHDALPISFRQRAIRFKFRRILPTSTSSRALRLATSRSIMRSEEHTSELQSRLHLVCRLLLEKKKKTTHTSTFLPQTVQLHYIHSSRRSDP